MQRICAAAIMAVVFGGSAMAQTEGTINFDGTVDDACAITATSDGILGVSSDYTLLDSAAGGGTPGGATVVSTDDNNTITVLAASAFANAPTGGGTNVAFDAQYDLSGGTTASDVAANTPVTLNQGSTTVSVDASATRTSGYFPAGDYAMEVTVRCTVT